MGKTLLLFSSHPADKVFATSAAAEAGLSVLFVTDPDAAVALIDQEEPLAVLVDASSRAQYQAFEGALQESLGLFSEKVNPGSIHFISSQALEEVDYLIQSPIFGNYIVRDTLDPGFNGIRYGRVIRAALGNKAFGLEQSLKKDTKIQKIAITRSTQKQDAVNAVRAFVLSAKFPTRTASIIANAVDELLMNAIFDAPVDETGRQQYATVSRSTDMPLEGKAQVELQVGFDGQVLGITAVDQFGSLDKQRLLSHISKIYVNEEYKVKTSVAGAGIGLATVFRSGGSFLFVSEAHVRTEVSVFFQRFDNYKQFKEQFHFLSTQFYF